MNKIIFGLLFMVILISIVGCTSSEKPVPVAVEKIEPQQETIPENAEVTTAPSDSDASKGPSEAVPSTVQEFDIIASKWKFTPGTIKVKQGDTVKLNLQSRDVMHGFRIVEFDVSKTLNPGEAVTVEFTADKKGTFSFFCTIPCGSGHSTMKGQLVVE